MMTTMTTILALLPIMFFTSAGSEMIKPMASPIIGGLVSATLTNLILVPVLYDLFTGRAKGLPGESHKDAASGESGKGA